MTEYSQPLGNKYVAPRQDGSIFGFFFRCESPSLQLTFFPCAAPVFG